MNSSIGHLADQLSDALLAAEAMFRARFVIPSEIHLRRTGCAMRYEKRGLFVITPGSCNPIDNVSIVLRIDAASNLDALWDQCILAETAATDQSIRDATAIALDFITRRKEVKP